MRTNEEIKEDIETLYEELDLEHVVIDFKETPHKYTCRNCGYTDKVEQNISIDYWLNLGRAFMLTHACCEKDIR